VHTAGTYDIPEEAGNAEAHIGRVTHDGQHNCGKTHSATGQDNEPVYFFHVIFASLFFGYLNIIDKINRKGKCLF
jgi:hypothetical protein